MGSSDQAVGSVWKFQQGPRLVVDVEAEGDARVEGGGRLGGRVDVGRVLAEHAGRAVVQHRVDAPVADGLGHDALCVLHARQAWAAGQGW